MEVTPLVDVVPVEDQGLPVKGLVYHPLQIRLQCHITLDMSDHRKGLDITSVEPAVSIHQTGVDEAIHLNLDEGHVNKAQVPDMDTNIHVDTGTVVVILQGVVHRGVTIIDMVTVAVLRVLVPKGVITIEVVTELTDAEITEAVLVQDTLSSTLYFSTLDLASGYYQIGLEEESIKKTAFITKYGLFEHTRMGFGLCNAPATFQRAMNLVLRGQTWTEVLVYIDDVIVLGNNFESHANTLWKVFNRMRQYNLKLNPKKCDLLKSEVEFLGRQVSSKRISITTSKADPIKNWPVPSTCKELESFLGYANYHRAQVQGYAGITSVLHEIVQPKSTFYWDEQHQEAF